MDLESLLAKPGWCMQNACMPAITIRNVPDDVRNELAARARGAGKSLQEFLLGELTDLASRPSVAALVEEVRRRKAAAPASVSTEEILRWRDEERR